MSNPYGPWHSQHLTYRALEPEDEPFLLKLQTDVSLFTQAAPFLPVPLSKKSSGAYREWLDTMLITAVICLPTTTTTTTTTSLSASASASDEGQTPIGIIHLSPLDPREIHHRRSAIGVNVAAPYQGQGYGSEAIKWILHWGFVYAGLHRIEVQAFGWNTGALRLYERLGFVMEGRQRESYWFEGRWWDLFTLGMLEGEWRGRYGGV